VDRHFGAGVRVPNAVSLDPFEPRRQTGGDRHDA
jgi:hypothetical protein